MAGGLLRSGQLEPLRDLGGAGGGGGGTGRGGLLCSQIHGHNSILRVLSNCQIFTYCPSMLYFHVCRSDERSKLGWMYGQQTGAACIQGERQGRRHRGRVLHLGRQAGRRAALEQG